MLSGHELLTLVPEASVCLQSKLDEHATLASLLPQRPLPNVGFVLLERGEDGSSVSGHWVLLIDQKHQIIYFDPYGGGPERGEAAVLGRFREGPNIRNLILRSGKQLVFDTTRFQRKSPHVNTCGRWCALRALFEDKDPRQFRNWVVDTCRQLGMQPDEMVVRLTDPFLSP